MGLLRDYEPSDGPSFQALISLTTQCRGVREDYVEILKRYVEVDIFGACGDRECGRTEDHNTRECDQMLERDYR